MIFENAKKHVLACLSFSVFLYCFGCLFGCLWGSFGALSEPLSSLWRAGVILLGAFGLPGLSVGSLCYFLWCLWLVWAALWALSAIFWFNLGAIVCCSFYVSPLLGEFRWCWACGLKVLVRRFSFLEISNVLPVPMLRQAFSDVQ